MKKTMIVMLCAFLLLAACTGSNPDNQNEHQTLPAETSEAVSFGQTEEPVSEAGGPILSYSLRNQPGWEDLKEGKMFSCDLDQDGTEEEITFQLRPNDEWATAVTWGDSTAVLDIGDELIRAEVTDLDPASPFLNLLVVADYGSDSYVTAELHPENGRLVQGSLIYGSYIWQDGSLVFLETTGLLGYGTGERTYHGDALVPDSEWLTMTGIPTGEELEKEKDHLVGMGILLHTIRPVPCLINGQQSELTPDTYAYRLRFTDNEEEGIVEVATLDGTVAQIFLAYDEVRLPYQIETLEMDEYFDNLDFSD